MSSVNNNDEVKKLREYYKKKEEELNAEAAKDKKRLVEAQKAEIDRISKNATAAHSKTRDETVTTINRADMRHSSDIDRIKAIHTKQLRDQAEHQHIESNALRKAYKENLERTEKIYNKNLAIKDERITNETIRHRDEMEETISGYNKTHTDKMGQQKQGLVDKHEKAEKTLIKQKAGEREELVNTLQSYKEAKKRETDHLKHKQRYETDKLKDYHDKVVSQKEMENQGVVEDMRELHIDGVDRERRQYAKALNQERVNLATAREDMQRSSSTKKIEELNNKIAQLEKQNLRNKQKMDRAKNRELDNVKMSYEDSIEVLRAQKQAMNAAHGKTKQEQIEEIEKRASDKVQNAHDFFQSRLEEEADHNDRNLTRMQKRLNHNNIQKNSMQDIRFKKFQDEATREQVNLQKNQNKSLALLKEEHDIALQEERKDQSTQRKVMQDSYEDRLNKLQLKQNEEIDKMQRQYSAMVEQLRSEFESQAQESARKIREASLEKEKNKDFEVKAKEAQFEYRLKRMEEAYNESLKRISNKHDESVRMLSGSGKDAKGRYA